jgi:hypothetical protein
VESHGLLYVLGPRARRDSKLGLLRSLPSLGATRQPPHLCAYSPQPPVRLHERAKRARADSMLARPPIPRNYGSAIVARNHLYLAMYGDGSEVATSSCKEAVPASGQTYRRELTSPDMTDRAWPVGTGRHPGPFKRFKTSSDATTCWQQDTEGIQDTSSGQKVFEILGNKLQPQNTV